jgi:MarR family 2-MHQ and catechol resistance regulon transcriptional repressor
MRASDAFAIYLQSDLGNRLTLSQFGVLEALLHRGPLYQGDLASKLLRSCGSITAVVAGLEKHGLVERQRMEEDRRFVRVSLTENGRKLISKIFPEHVKIITQQFRVLTVEEQEELRRLCRKLGTFIGKG